MTYRGSFRVIFGNVLAERLITEHAEKLAVGDAAKGFRAFTSKPYDVPLTGVDLFLSPHPGDSFQPDARPPDNSVRADPKATSQQRQADVLVQRLLPIAKLVELLLNGILRSLLIAVGRSPLIKAFGNEGERTKVGNTLQFINLFSRPPKIFLAFPVEAVLTGD
tara:strand:- start:97 stop:588 length:492 start_codon:yes stop_codon:yes gene_type:complete